MQFIREQLDKVEPMFEKGGKLEKLYPLYEATDTFLFTPGHKTASGPHVRDGVDLKKTMITVVLALIPATLFGMFNAGYQEMHAANPGVTLGSLGAMQYIEALLRGAWAFLPMYAVTVAVGGLIETVFAVIRKHEINEGFLVTSLLFPLTLPPSMPLWQVAIGIAFGVIVGKEIFGGTGMNILNPALTARIFLYFAYPAQISGDLVWVANNANWVDGYSGATPLASFFTHGANAPEIVTAAGGGLYSMTWMDAFLGFIPGSVGETSFVAIAIGAAILIATGVGSWRIMLSCVLGMVSTVLLLNVLAPSEAHYMAVSWQWHMVIGSFAFGTVFMATDPVSAAQTDTGRWIYGFLIGALTIVVRVLNPAYPAGIMLAIIFMNVFAPTIDYYVTKANIKRREVRLGLQ